MPTPRLSLSLRTRMSARRASAGGGGPSIQASKVFELGNWYIYIITTGATGGTFQYRDGGMTPGTYLTYAWSGTMGFPSADPGGENGNQNYLFTSTGAGGPGRWKSVDAQGSSGSADIALAQIVVLPTGLT